MSVGHGVDNVVDADADGTGCRVLRIAGVVGEFPRVANIGVISDGNHDAPFVVVNALPVGAASAVGAILAAGPNVRLARNLNALGEVVNVVQNRVVVGNLHHGPVGEDHFHRIEK